jgi:hypothetical protein
MPLALGAFQQFGGAVADLFAADGLRAKARGGRMEAGAYDRAAELALQNEQFTKTSTEIKEAQTQRGIYMTLGQQSADVASSGFEASGSSLDLLRDSAAQGALHKAVIGQQGLIDEAGFRQQADSYRMMAGAARMAADANDDAAYGADIGAVIKGFAGMAGLVMPGKEG